MASYMRLLKMELFPGCFLWQLKIAHIAIHRHEIGSHRSTGGPGPATVFVEAEAMIGALQAPANFEVFPANTTLKLPDPSHIQWIAAAASNLLENLRLNCWPFCGLQESFDVSLKNLLRGSDECACLAGAAALRADFVAGLLR